MSRDLNSATGTAYGLLIILLVGAAVYLIFRKQIWSGLISAENSLFTAVDAMLYPGKANKNTIVSGISNSASNVLDPLMGWVMGSTWNLSQGKGPMPLFQSNLQAAPTVGNGSFGTLGGIS